MLMKDKFQRRLALRLLIDEDGGPAAEFALILVPMVIIFVLIMQFGVLLFVHNDMHNAARDAVRQWSVVEGIQYSGSSESCQTGTITVNSVEDVACRHLALWNSVVDFQVTSIAVSGGVGDADCDRIEVLVEADMADATLFNILGVLSGRTLSVEAVMRSQWDVIEGGAPQVEGACA
jgi:hypothetical protein